MIVWFLIALIVLPDGHVEHRSTPFVSESACRAVLKEVSPDMGQLPVDSYVLECVPTHLLKKS